MNSQENYRTITVIDVVNIFEKLKLENIVTYLSDCIILRRKYDNILVYIFNKDELIIDKSDIEYIINQRIILRKKGYKIDDIVIFSNQYEYISLNNIRSLIISKQISKFDNVLKIKNTNL